MFTLAAFRWTRDESGHRHRQSNPLFSRAAHPHICHHLLFDSLLCQCHQDHHLYAHHCLISSLIIITIVPLFVWQHSMLSSLASMSSLDAWRLFCCCFVIILFCFVLGDGLFVCQHSRLVESGVGLSGRLVAPSSSSVASSSQLVAQNNNLLLVL